MKVNLDVDVHHLTRVEGHGNILVRVENGEVTHMIQAPSYQGITPEFWNSCSGITKEKHWRMMGTPNCGKGEPMQVIYTGHGSSPARFDDIQVGIVQ